MKSHYGVKCTTTNRQAKKRSQKASKKKSEKTRRKDAEEPTREATMSLHKRGTHLERGRGGRTLRMLMKLALGTNICFKGPREKRVARMEDRGGDLRVSSRDGKRRERGTMHPSKLEIPWEGGGRPLNKNDDDPLPTERGWLFFLGVEVLPWGGPGGEKGVSKRAFSEEG